MLGEVGGVQGLNLPKYAHRRLSRSCHCPLCLNAVAPCKGPVFVLYAAAAAAGDDDSAGDCNAVPTCYESESLKV
eukprot:1160590-Pelagomonas_calceolata.AAC.8